MRKGIEYFERATEEDPNYELAYAGLAESYASLGAYLYVPHEEAKLRAQGSIVKAREIGGYLAETHFARGMVKFSFDVRLALRSDRLPTSYRAQSDHALSHAYCGLLWKC